MTLPDETLPRVAIVGAGPMGLEAALYARFLGYPVQVFERGHLAANIRRWGHVRMFSPFSLNCSRLGLAAVGAQDSSFQPPPADTLLTGREYFDLYLLPLSQTDLVAGCIHEFAEVLFVGRDGPIKTELDDTCRADSDFRLLVRDAAGGERTVEADIVIDTSGTYGNPNWLGLGGIPAPGEMRWRAGIEYELPDVLGRDRNKFAGRSTLVVGSGYSAATTAVALAELAVAVHDTHVVWITRRPVSAGGPVPRFEHDRLPERDRLAAEANRLAGGDSTSVAHWGATWVVAIERDDADDGFQVELGGERAGRRRFDQIVANVGYRAETRIYSELHVHECYATGGPMKVAAALLKDERGDCLDQPSTGPESLMNPEPDFFILGSKSYGRQSNFLLSTGFAQIRDLFSHIAGRKNLDLYQTMDHFPGQS